MEEEKYVITEDYFNEYEDILGGSDFEEGTIVTQEEDGTLHLVEEESKGPHTNGPGGDPVLPPPRPPIVP